MNKEEMGQYFVDALGANGRVVLYTEEGYKIMIWADEIAQMDWPDRMVKAEGCKECEDFYIHHVAHFTHYGWDAHGYREHKWVD